MSEVHTCCLTMAENRHSSEAGERGILHEEELLEIFNPNDDLQELDRISIEPVEDVARPGQDLPPLILATSQHQKPPPVLQQRPTVIQQPPQVLQQPPPVLQQPPQVFQQPPPVLQQPPPVHQIVACVLCKDPVVEGDPYRLHLWVEHHTTLEDIFQEGDQLGGNRVVCYWGCGANVEKGQVYWSHVASEHARS